MSIIQSVIRIYDAATALPTDLVTQKTTSGPSTSITIDDNLEEGTNYWATAQVEDDSHIQSAESAPFAFSTLPDVEFFSAPTAGSDYISAQLNGITQDVTISYYGLQYSTSSSFSPLNEAQDAQGYVDIYNLTEHTSYWVRPFVIDQYNRKWVNTGLARNITTAYAKPTLTWTGISTISATSWSQSINIQSLDALTSVVCTYTPAGGSAQTMSMSATTGTQTCSLTGLTPNTTYTVVVRATNSAGYTDSQTLTIRTDTSVATVATSAVSVNNASNHITATSTATYDSTVITLVSNSIALYTNNAHSGSPVSVSTGSSDVFTDTLPAASPDTEYYIFGHITYTVGSDPTIIDAWSDGERIRTYALLSFGNITTTNNTASVPYSISGVATSVNIEMSVDQSTWTAQPASTSGGTLSITSLTPNTTYYIRGRVQSTAGWSDYITSNFTTTNVLPTVVVDSVTNITPTEATINLTIS